MADLWDVTVPPDDTQARVEGLRRGLLVQDGDEVVCVDYQGDADTDVIVSLEGDMTIGQLARLSRALVLYLAPNIGAREYAELCSQDGVTVEVRGG